MKNDWKLILGVVLGSAVLLLIIIFGLSRLSGSGGDLALKVDESVLTNGARFVKNNGETKVTVVEFMDMQCPACKQAHQAFAPLVNKPGVTMVMRMFPLPAEIHKNALIGAKAAEAARGMGKGWEMVDLLFSKQDEWGGENDPTNRFGEYAKSLGLDQKTFVENLNSKAVAENVMMDKSLGDGLRLSGTPTVFVNGEQVGVAFVVDKVNSLLAK